MWTECTSHTNMYPRSVLNRFLLLLGIAEICQQRRAETHESGNREGACTVHRKQGIVGTHSRRRHTVPVLEVSSVFDVKTINNTWGTVSRVSGNRVLGNDYRLH